MLGGIGWAGNIDQWIAYKPTDPLGTLYLHCFDVTKLFLLSGQLVVAMHTYDFTKCSSTPCWEQVVAPIAQQAYSTAFYHLTILM